MSLLDSMQRQGPLSIFDNVSRGRFQAIAARIILVLWGHSTSTAITDHGDATRPTIDRPTTDADDDDVAALSMDREVLVVALSPLRILSAAIPASETRLKRLNGGSAVSASLQTRLLGTRKAAAVRAIWYRRIARR